MPRFLIAAAHKSSGKTVVSTGLAAALTARGQSVQTFKKGPDYIDPMWLSAASHQKCYNLDFNIMDPTGVFDFYSDRAQGSDLALVEANKGLFDGLALDGTDSNAALAKLLQTPVVLVVDTTGTTRGIAPLLLGYSAFDPLVNIAGVILNKTGGERHEGKLRAAVERYTDIPVIGAIRRNRALEIGERHLGLTTPAETGGIAPLIDEFSRIIASSVNLDAVIALARTAPGITKPPGKMSGRPPDVKIAIARDAAFGFYYPDDLEAFAAAGATLVPFDTLHDKTLPAVDGLFIGGGFPETQMDALAANQDLRHDIKTAIERGLPTYAECGGLMYLCENLHWKGHKRPMIGAIPGQAIMCEKPQGRGYAKFTNTSAHLWESGTSEINAHEFHYAKVEGLPDNTRFARKMSRGNGILSGFDAITHKNMIAGFCHLRSCRENPWVTNFVRFVRKNKYS